MNLFTKKEEQDSASQQSSFPPIPADTKVIEMGLCLGCLASIMATKIEGWSPLLLWSQRTMTAIVEKILAVLECCQDLWWCCKHCCQEAMLLASGCEFDFCCSMPWYFDNFHFRILGMQHNAKIYNGTK